MPKSENLDRLGSIAFILGNKELPADISKEDYYNYKSVFSDETIESGGSLINTKISKDDQALAELQANDSGISDNIKTERQKEIEEQLKKELAGSGNKEQLLKPEDILSTLSDKKEETIEVKEDKSKKEEKPKKETKADRIQREKEAELKKTEDKIKREEAIKADKDKKELDDLDALLGSLDDILDGDIFEDEKTNDVVEDIKEDDSKKTAIDDTKNEINNNNDEETPIDEIVDEDNHIEANIDDIDDEGDKKEDVIVPIADNNIKSVDEVVEDADDKDIDIDSIVNDIKPPKPVNENFENDDTEESIDDLDAILDEFNSVANPKSPEELEEELDKEIEAMNAKSELPDTKASNANNETLDDISAIDDLDSILEEFNNVIEKPEEETEIKNEDVEDTKEIKDAQPEIDKLDEEDDNIDIPSLDEIEEEVSDIIEKEAPKLKEDDNLTKDEIKDEIEEDDDTIEREESLPVAEIELNTPPSDEDNNKYTLPPPDTVFESSKYGNLASKYNNDKILKNIEKLHDGIQFSVLDAILNENISNKDMDTLLSLLEKNASEQKISNLLTGNVVSPKTIVENTKKAVDLIPIPNSLKEYASVIRYAAIFIIGLIAISILGYQFIYKPLRANSYFARGLAAVENADYEMGELNFNRGDMLKPKQTKWYNKYANAYMDKERFDDAYNKINMSLKVLPDDFENKITLGDYYRRRGENDLDTALYVAGEKLYDDMLTYENKNDKKSLILDKRGLLMISRANTLNDNTFLKKAYDNYQTMLRTEGDTPFVRKRMMQIRIYQDDYEQVKLLRTYIDTMKKGYFDDDVYPMLARYLLYKDDFHSARTIFENVLKKYRDCIPAIVGYAEYETRLKHYDKARNILVNAALPLYEERKITKGKEFVYNLLGQIYYNLTQYGNATREFLNALAINPIYPDANYNLGNVYFYQENNYEKAKMYYQVAYTNAPKELLDDKLVYNLSWINYADKEYDKAFEGFLTLFNRESDNVVVSYALANSLMRLDKDVLARGFYNNALNHVLEKRAKLGKLGMRTEKEYALINYMASLYNNLGVSYAHTYVRDRKVSDEQESFKNFVLASQYFDQIRTSNIELQRMEKRTLNLGSQNIAIPTYNIMTMQTRRNLKETLAIDDYIPKIMNSLN